MQPNPTDPASAALPEAQRRIELHAGYALEMDEDGYWNLLRPDGEVIAEEIHSDEARAFAAALSKPETAATPAPEIDGFSDCAKAILASKHKRNIPGDKPGERLVGFVMPADVAGLSDALFALEEILSLARRAQAAEARKAPAAVAVPAWARARAEGIAASIRGLIVSYPQHDMIGLRGKAPEAIAFLRANELLSVLDAIAAPEPEPRAAAPVQYISPDKNQLLALAIWHAREGDFTLLDRFKTELEGLNTAPPESAPDLRPGEVDVRKCETEAIEAEAQRVYESWSGEPGYVPWTPRGNSHKQEQARDSARRRLSTSLDRAAEDGRVE